MAAQRPPRPPSRPSASVRLDVRAALWFAHSVLISLALMSGSWRMPTDGPVDELALFAPVEPWAPLADSLVVTDLAVTDAVQRPGARRRARSVPGEIRALAPRPGETLPIDAETLWLARCIYSESDRPHEQELVAWVVRNRVATGYRGKRTYEGVVLDPKQFSAFNAGAPRRGFYLGLRPESQAPGWRRALLIAAYVRHAPWSRRPFDVRVRHFYSEVSMVGRRHPTWAIGETPVRPNRPYVLDPYRFRFLSLSREV